MKAKKSFKKITFHFHANSMNILVSSFFSMSHAVKFVQLENRPIGDRTGVVC